MIKQGCSLFIYICLCYNCSGCSSFFFIIFSLFVFLLCNLLDMCCFHSKSPFSTTGFADRLLQTSQVCFFQLRSFARGLDEYLSVTNLYNDIPLSTYSVSPPLVSNSDENLFRVVGSGMSLLVTKSKYERQQDISMVVILYFTIYLLQSWLQYLSRFHPTGLDLWAGCLLGCLANNFTPNYTNEPPLTSCIQ